MAILDPNDPSIPSAAHQIMAKRLWLLETVLGGTETMRQAGQILLPRHPEESDDNYNNRLSTATLLNVTELTLDNLVGKPFDRKMQLGEQPPEMVAFFDDVDKLKNNIDVFARAWFRDGLLSAFAGVLVEFPIPTPRADGLARTKADDLKENLKPYFVPIPTADILEVIEDPTTGELLQLRYQQYVQVRKGFIVENVKQIRILEAGLPGENTTIRTMQERKSKGGKSKWVQVGEVRNIDLDYIPFVFFYSVKREDVAQAKPCLLDLSYLNVAHWQSSSDQQNILTVARFPMLAGSGVPDEEQAKVKVGPRQALMTTDPMGKYYYVESAGTAIEAGRKDIEHLEQQMAGYGAQFLKKQPGRTTATSRQLDSQEAMSQLEGMAIAFEDSINHAIAIAADWMDVVPGTKVQVNKTFQTATTDSNGLAVLDNARNQRDISRKAYLEALVVNGLLPPSYDPVSDANEIATEKVYTPLNALADPEAKPVDKNVVRPQKKKPVSPAA